MNNFNINNKSKTENGLKKNIITVEGDLALQNSAELKEKLWQTLKSNDIIHLQAKNVTDIDITFLQLVYSLRKTAATMNKTITLDIELPQKVFDLIERLGFAAVIKN